MVVLRILVDTIEEDENEEDDLENVSDSEKTNLVI